MKVFEVSKHPATWRWFGHGHAGKTSIVSAALFTAGATQRMGRVDDGTAPPPTTTRKKSPAKCRFRHRHCLRGVGQDQDQSLDTPGFNMFVHEAKTVLPVVEAALVVVDGVAGVEVVTQRVWGYCRRISTCRASSSSAAAGSRSRRCRPRPRVAQRCVRACGCARCNSLSARRRASTGVVDLVKMKAYYATNWAETAG